MRSQPHKTMRTIAVDSPYGQGGVGQHFAQLVEASREHGMLDRYYALDVPSDDSKGHPVTVNTYGVLKYTPLRFSTSWKSYVLGELFDRKIAARLEAPLGRYMGFVGRSLKTFERAAELDADRIELVAVNSHVDNLQRLHERANRDWGFGDSWLNGPQRRKTLREYEQADVIYVHSEYTKQSFIEAGIPPEKLERTYLYVDPHFAPPEERSSDGPFHVVYVGRVDATKGIPLLLEAFDHMAAEPRRLTIVGNWSTRGMRKYMEGWLEKDNRIRVAPGDPLPVLHDADVFVHPTYEDGLGYAPMEALACGVPTIVTEDTGMKEYVIDGENGYIVPTGDRRAIVDRLDAIAQRETLRARTHSLLPEYAPTADDDLFDYAPEVDQTKVGQT